MIFLNNCWEGRGRKDDKHKIKSYLKINYINTVNIHGILFRLFYIKLTTNK